MASIESTLMEKPAMYMIKKTPINETGMAMVGIMVTRQSRKNKKMIITTKAKAI